MDNRTKVLILHASAGHGHAKAAKAIYDAMVDRLEYDVKLVDALSYTAPRIGAFYRWVYFSQIQRLPWLWAFFYHVTDVRWIYFFVRPLRRMLNGPLARPLHKLLVSENPSIIVATHFLSTEVASYLKGRGKINSKLVTVVTDYMPHCVWTATNVDFYAVAVEDTKAGLIRRGVPERKIRVTGIPIEKKFLLALPREKAAQNLGLDALRFTVLITGGGAGIGGAGEIAARLSREEKAIQTVLVCGMNKPLYERMYAVASNFSNLRVFGFVNNMQELMDASDLVVGKGGGLTVTESLAKGKPLILFQSVPGQERRNDKIVERYGAGFAAGSVDKVLEKIIEFAKNRDQFERARAAVMRLAAPGAAEALVRIVRDEC